MTDKANSTLDSILSRSFVRKKENNKHKNKSVNSPASDIATYGSEIWKLSKEKKGSLQTRCLRLLNMIRNGNMRQRSRVKSIEQRITVFTVS